MNKDLEKWSIQQIKAYLAQLEGPLDGRERQLLASDSRKGVRNLLLNYDKAEQKRVELIKIIKNKRHLELSLKTSGYKAIAGVDEVGRGPLAGPVIAAAVILPEEFPYLPLADSKTLSAKARLFFAEEIKEKAIAYAFGLASVEEIDQLNILNASRLAMERAVLGLNIPADYLLIDAINLNIQKPQKAIIKGDDKVYIISAASIIAKVYRDELMKTYHIHYPVYDFSSNMGYGTKKHLDALEKYGPCAIHRKTFKPVQERN